MPRIRRDLLARNRTVKDRAPFSDRRALLLALVVVLGMGVIALVSTAPAMAKTKSCAQQIVEDWYDNQRVDKLYPLHCYHEALDSLGPDTQDYTDLPEAILRALAYRQAGNSDPGAGAAGRNGIKPIAWRRTSDVVTPIAVGGTQAAADPAASTAGPSSVPIPLIVLAGLAGLLLIAGGAGYIARRVQSRRGGPPAS